MINSDCLLSRGNNSTYLSNVLDYLDKNVERCIFGCNHGLLSFGEQTVYNTLQTADGLSVTLTLDSDHVHPVK